MKEKSIRNKKKTKKIIRTVIFWLLLAAFLGWFASLRLNLQNNPNSYDYVIPFESRPLNQYRSASGKIVMNDIETVSTDVTQKVKTVYFKLGDHVNEGDILCEFESDALDEQIQRIEKYISDRKAAENLENSSASDSAEYRRQLSGLSVESASMAVAAARKAYDDTYDKYAEYFKKCYDTSDPAESEMFYQMYTQYESQLDKINEEIISSQKAYEKALESANKMSEAQDSTDYIKSLTASDLDDYEKELEKLKNEREHLVVKAPKSGIIADCYIAEGGYSFDGGLFRIGTLGSYKIEAYLTDSDILDIKPGMEAAFKTTLTGGDEISAKVTKVSDIYSSAGPDSFLGGFAVELEITDDSHMQLLRHNVSTSAKIYTVNLGSLPAVQYDAIAEDKDGNSFVYKAVKKGGNYVAEKVKVEKGYESDFYIEVTSDELKEGDLIVGNVSEHNEGDQLKIKGMAG